MLPVIQNPRNLELPVDAEAILQEMFKGYQRIVIKDELSALGYSGSWVYRIHSLKADNAPELPVVVKIASASLIEKERQAYQHCIHNQWLGVAELYGEPIFSTDSDIAGLCYTLMGGGVFELESLYNYCLEASIEDLGFVLEKRLFRIMQERVLNPSRVQFEFPLQSSYDVVLPVNLLIEPHFLAPGSSPTLITPGALPTSVLHPGDPVHLEGFAVTHVDLRRKTVTLNLPPGQSLYAYRVRLRSVNDLATFRVGQLVPSLEGTIVETRQSRFESELSKVLGPAFDPGKTLVLPGDLANRPIILPNPLQAIPSILGESRNIKINCIHGDMNLENILVDPQTRDVSLIDFAEARQDHVLHDFLHLETEVITKLVPPVLVQADLPPETIYLFYEQLHHATFRLDQGRAYEAPHAALEKAFAMVCMIRKAAREGFYAQDDFSEYYQGLMLYLSGTLRFRNLDQMPTVPLPKRIAFWAAATVCNFLKPVPTRPILTQEWERARRYLPAKLYQEKREPTCLLHMNQLLRMVTTYLPRHLALESLKEPGSVGVKGQFLEGTLLFVDISGLNILSESLRTGNGKEGAEKLVQIINEYLDASLGILFRYGGLLIKFSGDAMLCLFTGSNYGAMNAVWAAQEMIHAVDERFAKIVIAQEIVSLKVKAGGNSGLLFAAHVGTAERMEYILTGNAVERAARAGSAAYSGDILISRETLELIQDDLDVEELAGRPGFFKVKGIHTDPVPTQRNLWENVEKILSKLANDWPGIIDRLNAVTAYLPVGVLSQLVHGSQSGQIEGQHRKVTVLLTNFAGVSDIMEAHGVGAPHAITADLNAYFKTMQEEISYYGGVVNKVDLYDQGDKLVAIFGAPLAHEKDAQRAALAALAMQAAMSRLPSPTAAQLLSQRIGIHTGFVFAGNVGASTGNRREYAILGETVNLATHLMSAAPPGEIWISGPAWDQIKTGFKAKRLPSIKFEGITAPVSVYQLQAPRAIPTGRRRPSTLHSDIVGREAELEVLEEYAGDLLLCGGKHIVAVSGEAGVGKTRLIEEWHQRIDERVGEKTITWLTGRGYSYGQKTNGVFVEIVEQILGIDDDDDGDRQKERWDKLSSLVKDIVRGRGSGWGSTFTDKIAYLGHFLGLEFSAWRDLAEQIESLEPKVLQLQERLAVCDVLEHAAQAKPSILVLEDLHWADEASLDMLKFILDKVNDALPVLFCLVYRPLKEGAIWRLWQDIERSYPDCCPISLRELKGTDGRQLLCNLLQTRHLPEDFQSLILGATDGNPLYMEEVLLALIEEGTLAQEESHWQVTQSIERIQVPDSLYQIIQSRVDELDMGSPGARRLLWMASVLGEEFGEELLLHLFTSTGRGKNEFLSHLRELRNAAMIQRIRKDDPSKSSLSQREYRFRHSLVRQVVYENMLMERRCEYHSQVGHWLKGRYSEELSRHYDTLAHHYDQGRQWEDAFEYHRLAGTRDARAFANSSAVSHLRRAIEIADLAAPGTDELIQAHFELGKVLSSLAELEGALEHLNIACDLSESAAGETAALRRARICYHIGRLYERKGGSENYATALEWQSKGLALLPEEPGAETVLLHVLGGIVGLRQGDLDRLIKVSQHALILAHTPGAESELGTAYRLLSNAFYKQGRLDLALAYCQRGIEVDQALSDLNALAIDYLNQGTFALYAGNWQLARESNRKAIDLSERIGDRYRLAMAYCNLADQQRYLGDLTQGLDYAQRGLDLFTRIESRQGMIFARAVLGPLLWRQGELEQARVQLLRAREWIETYKATQFEHDVGRWLAQVYLSEGKVTQAEVEIQTLLAGETDLDTEIEPVQRLQGQILAAQGQLDESIRVLQDSLKRLDQGYNPYETGCTHKALAEVWEMGGKWTESRLDAERARAIFANLGARPDLQEVDDLIERMTQKIGGSKSQQADG